MDIFALVILIIGIALLCLSLYLLYVTLGFRKGKTAKCKGYLEEVTHRKNVYRGRSQGGFYKNYVWYVYVYKVNGKKYRISGGVPGVKGNLSNTVTVVYQKRNPKFAHLDGMPFPVEAVMTIVFFLLSLVFLSGGMIHS